MDELPIAIHVLTLSIHFVAALLIQGIRRWEFSTGHRWAVEFSNITAWQLNLSTILRISYLATYIAGQKVYIFTRIFAWWNMKDEQVIDNWTSWTYNLRIIFSRFCKHLWNPQKFLSSKISHPAVLNYACSSYISYIRRLQLIFVSSSYCM